MFGLAHKSIGERVPLGISSLKGDGKRCSLIQLKIFILNHRRSIGNNHLCVDANIINRPPPVIAALIVPHQHEFRCTCRIVQGE